MRFQAAFGKQRVGSECPPYPVFRLPADSEIRRHLLPVRTKQIILGVGTGCPCVLLFIRQGWAFARAFSSAGAVRNGCRMNPHRIDRRHRDTFRKGGGTFLSNRHRTGCRSPHCMMCRRANRSSRHHRAGRNSPAAGAPISRALPCRGAGGHSGNTPAVFAAAGSLKARRNAESAASRCPSSRCRRRRGGRHRHNPCAARYAAGRNVSAKVQDAARLSSFGFADNIVDYSGLKSQ